MSLALRPYRAADEPALLAIARELVEDGTTYVFAPDTSDDELRAFWLNPAGWLTVAEDASGAVLGLALLKPNQPGRGRHVANAAYAVSRAAQGRGVGEALARHSLEEARRRGFRAVQFNFVVATNERAVRLWQHLGFAIVGTLPRVFQHPDGRLVDAYVMHRDL